MFGSGFGAQRPSQTQPAFGFGQAQPQTTQSSLFGQPATSSPQTGSAFGAPAGAPSGGLFGSQTNAQAPTPFGAPSGNGIGLGASQQQQGTAKASFVATELPDPAKGLSKTDRFQTITMMPAYENMSLQELRWQDYQANRKGPSPSAGSVSGFGFGSQPAATPSENSGGLFGQPQASNSPFGTGSATNSAFGGGANTGGSLFGRNPSTTTPGTGLFGSNNNAQPSGGSAFGGTGSTSGGLFGQNSTSTPAFGQPAAPSAGAGFGFGANQGSTTAGTGLFGQSNTSGSSGLFGSNQPSTSSPFGQSNNTATGNTGFGFGTQPQASAQPSGAFGSSTGGGLFGQNNTANTNSNTFRPNNTTPFGGSTNNASSGGLFGQNQNQNQGGGLFGSNNPSTGNTGFGFGSQTNGSSGGLFGSANNNNNTGASGGLFGQNNSQPSGGLFGNSGSTLGQQPGSGFGFGGNQNKPATGFGSTTGAGFGQPSTTNAFGTNSGASTTGGGLFGQNSNNTQQPGTSTGFGFGQNNSTNTNTNTSGSLFGQPQQPKTGFGFGQAAGNTGSTSGTTGGLFGSNASKPATGGLFGGGTGAGAAPSNPGTGGSGLFGGNNTGASSGTGGGLFGNTGAANPGTNATSGFGANNNSTASNGPTNGGLFGSSNSNTSGGGLFGNKPATGGGLFGNSTANTTNTAAPKPTFGSSSTTGGSSLFGGSSGLGGTQTQPNQGSTGLFGSTNNKPSGGLFGNSGTMNNSGTGLSFGNTSTAPAPTFGNQGTGGSLFAQQQPSGPVASIGSNAYGSNPLFTNVQQPATASTQDEQPQAVPKKDDATFKPPTGVLLAHIMQPHQLLVKRQRWGNGRNPKDAEESKTLDEYSKVPPWPATAANVSDSTSQDNEERKKIGGATGFASVRFRNVLFSNNTDDIILNSEAFDLTRHRALPSSRNVIEVDEAPRAVSVSTPTKAAAKDENSSIVLETHGGSLSEPIPDNSEAQVAENSKTKEDSDISQSEIQEEGSITADASLAQPEPDTPDNEIVNEDGYWISPAQHRLTNMTLREIRKTKDFRVGQRTHGFVEFLEPVDLSAYSNVQTQVCGRLVVISDRSFCLYPVESERPPVGQGFNVKHRVTLYNVFARTRDTQEPVKDPEHPLCKRFAKRLRTKGTFVSWSAQIGTWTFEVDPAKDNS